MIEKMKYINITGHLSDIDRVIERYISKYEIQFENAARELKNINGLEPLNLPNPYVVPLKISERMANAVSKMEHKPEDLNREISADDAFITIETAEKFFTAKSRERNALIDRRQELARIISEIEPFRNLVFCVKNLSEFRFIKYKFGKMPYSNFKQLETFMHDKPEILFEKGKSEAEYIWVVYFTADVSEEMVDSIFSTLQFVQTDFTYTLDGVAFDGTPQEYYDYLNEKVSKIDNEIQQLESKTLDEADIKNSDIILSHRKILSLHNVFEIKKYAAQTVHDYYIFVGWTTERNATKLEKEMEQDNNVVLMIEEGPGVGGSVPPTKLKNIKLFQPFEFFVKMYGLPSYGEFDPTAFMAVTYTIIFGLMFGDLGQGLILSLLGVFLYLKKGMLLGRILGIIGVSSMFFGLMYGSFFGFEHFIPTIWMKPSENINYILILTVVAGFFLILTAIAINIVKLLRNKQYIQVFVDPNGIPGLVFYATVACTAALTLTGYFSVPTELLVPIVVFSLIIIAFREPIIRLARKEKNIIHGSVPMFLLETVIELFEVVLSYLTNTISFVRVGAFALSHAGMMSVVILLSESSDGSRNIAIIVIGNILVIALEGLVVGIQVLRLEFYEMFSRFYKGSGREFIPSVKK